MPTDVKDIRINEKIRIGGKNPLVLIGGPCVLENRDHAFSMARKISAICQDLKVPYIFKASYDKANRSSLKSFRGPGLNEGLQILSEIKQELEACRITDPDLLNEEAEYHWNFDPHLAEELIVEVERLQQLVTEQEQMLISRNLLDSKQRP